MTEQSFQNTARVILALIIIIIVGVFLLGTALPQESMMSIRPRGFFGEGHDINHPYYQGLHNANGGSCCNGKDCRPTQARFLPEVGLWQVMVNGEWVILGPSEGYKILTDEILRAQGAERWDAQAHVCAGEAYKTIYCFIPPASGQ